MAWQGSWHGGDVMCDSDGGGSGGGGSGGGGGGTWQPATTQTQWQLQWEMIDGGA